MLRHRLDVVPMSDFPVTWVILWANVEVHTGRLAVVEGVCCGGWGAVTGALLEGPLWWLRLADERLPSRIARPYAECVGGDSRGSLATAGELGLPALGFRGRDDAAVGRIGDTSQRRGWTREDSGVEEGRIDHVRGVAVVVVEGVRLAVDRKLGLRVLIPKGRGGIRHGGRI